MDRRKTLRRVAFVALLAGSGSALALDLPCPTLTPGQTFDKNASWSVTPGYRPWVVPAGGRLSDKWTVPAGFKWTSGPITTSGNMWLPGQFVWTLNCSGSGFTVQMFWGNPGDASPGLAFHAGRQAFTDLRDLAATIQDDDGNLLTSGFLQVPPGSDVAVQNGKAFIPAVGSGTYVVKSPDKKSSVHGSFNPAAVGPAQTLNLTFKIVMARSCRFRVSNGSTHHVSYDFRDVVGKNSCEATCSNDRAREVAKALLGWSKSDTHVDDTACTGGSQCAGKGSCRT